MRYFIVVCLLYLVAFEAIGQRKSDEVLFIRNMMCDFGIVKRDTLLNARYYMMNRGNTEIKINSIRAECICTHFFVSNYTIKPNDSIYVDVSLNTKGLAYGEQRLYTVVNADTETKMYKLTLKANVKK